MVPLFILLGGAADNMWGAQKNKNGQPLGRLEWGGL
jgi:hypothetical protein